LLIDKSKINEYLIFNLNKQFLDSNHVDSLRIRIQNTKKVCVQDYIPLNDSNLVFYIGAPIYDTFEQVMRGIIIFELPILQINKIMNTDNDKNGLGKTGEAYIVGNDFLLRTSSRFKENSIKSVTVKTTATINAFSNKVGVSLMKDYRNIEVLSSYSPLNISGLKWAILAEMDREEALQQIYDLRNSIVILCIIVSIFIFGLVYLGSMKLTTPIILLKDAATKISEGKYNVRVNLKSNDEMGELITSFNNMAEQLSLQSEQIVKDKLLRISSVIDAQEQERQRLSRDLHDGLGQMLLAVKIKLEQLKNYDIEKLKINMSDALELLKNSISEIRTISNDLTPTVLANFGLEDSIKKLCRDCLGTANITFDLKCEGLATVKLNAKKQIYIFRIIQEIINNITKHSAASSVQISIFTLNDMIEFNISDNGKGFDLNYTNKGNGLNNIMERCELMNGICNIESNENHGTSFRITIPTI